MVRKIYHALAENMRNPASIQSHATVGPAYEWPFTGGPIVARFYVLIVKWAAIGLIRGGGGANQASIQSRATIGQLVKNCSLVEINDQRRSKDRRPNCCLWCLFVWLFAISELNWWKVLSCHYFQYNYGYPFYPLERDMATLLPSVRFYKCVIIARYNIAFNCREVRWNECN